MSLQALLLELPTEDLKHIDDVLLEANIAYSLGKPQRVKAIFKREKQAARGKVRKIFAAFQKADFCDLRRALDHHFEYRNGFNET